MGNAFIKNFYRNGLQLNELLEFMSKDMGINIFYGETEESFVYRLCYSALGQWCLRIAQNLNNRSVGTSKYNQTNILNELLARYSELFPIISNKFIDISNQKNNFSVFIRRTYEETGYLLTDEKNYNHLANYGRSIQIATEALFFGIPNEAYTVNGLGIFSSPTTYQILPKEFLIRDDLTCEEYFQSRFDPIDFSNRDIDIDELEFFNPKLNKIPSKSWDKKMITDYSVARKTETGPFYRVMKVSDKLQFAEEPIEMQDDSFISYEFRRLYFAMKSHYSKPLEAYITRYDDAYSKIQLKGHLPNREYYFLLLVSWPEYNAFDKANFIIRNNLILEVSRILKNIGIEVRGVDRHE